MVDNSAESTITNEKCANRESPTMLNDQTIVLNFVRNRLETFQDTVLRDVQKRMSSMIDEVMQELRQYQLQANEFRNFAKPRVPNTSSHKKNTCNLQSKSTIVLQKHDAGCEAAEDDNVLRADEITGGNQQPSTSKKYHKLPSKEYVMRESLLTALLEVEHMKTIYHIFYIIVMVFLLNNVTTEYLMKGSVSFGLGTFRSGFENIEKVAGIWILQHIFVFGVYYGLKSWSQIRLKLDKHKNIRRLWTNSCLLLYIATQLAFAYLPTKVCLYLNLPFVTASVLLLETVRLLMKMHSFVRTMVPRIVEGKVKVEQEIAKINFPKFHKYLYFLFAPTLLFRNEYPRTSTIRWRFALARFLEVVAVAFLYNYIYDHHIKHNFENFCLQESNASNITIKLFGMLMPGIIIFLAGFYMILHAWLNFTAELLRFGDRMFYRDWWTVSNYEAYYRNWNVVVHDWLYEYIYKDCYKYVFKGSKGLSSLTVFTISAIFHEYVLGYALQVTFPVIFIFFGVIGVFLIFVTRNTPKNLGNIFLWFSLIYGNCWIISLYSMEYFARINYPKEYNSWTDFFVPHLWSCNLK